MNDSEFIELLNLYLDHEITASDAARLEAEVSRSPERRRLYQEYCRMQKACTLLAKDFTDEASTAAIDRATVVVMEQPRRAVWAPSAFAAAGLLAAACLAIVLNANRKPESSRGTGEVPSLAAVPVTGSSAATVVAPDLLVTTVDRVTAPGMVARTVTVPASARLELQPAFALRSLALSNTLQTPESSNEKAAGAQLQWIKSLQVTPVQLIQAEDLRFDARPVDVTKSSIYGTRNRPAQQGVIEMTAFQFTK
jgi:anti-sigma factor RsiW